jgi:hypothetical protein
MSTRKKQNYWYSAVLPIEKELEKIKHRIDIVGVVLVEESILFQTGNDGIFADTDVISPLLKGDNFPPGCGLMGSPAHRCYFPLQHVVIR